MFETREVLNPFPGLRPFETEETNLFFGRDGQSDELLARLRRTRFLAVVGTSGSGKSSLIRAGLLPALYGGLMGSAGSNWRIAILRPGHDPIGNLANALGENGVLGAYDQDFEIQNTLIETTLRRSSIGVVDATQQARMSSHENLMIVVDQFEELFRFKEARKETASEDDAAAFVKLLLEASAQSEVPIYVVLTMRSDFLGDCSQFSGLPEAINLGQYLIPRMSRDERRSAITGPVAVGGGEITLPLVSRLLNDVGDNPDQLPILQHALMRTWDYWAAHRRNGEPIGLEHYETIGTMAGALSLHADEAWDDLPDNLGKDVAEKLFKALTEKGTDNREIRRPTQLSEISSSADVTEGEVVAVIEVFRREGRSFLMPPVGVELLSNAVIDISHESLIRNWDRLQKWADEEALSARIYRRLAEAAVLHHEGKEGLLIDPALQIALEWREKQRPNSTWANRYHSEFETAIGFLDASREHRDAQLAAEREREQRELERARDFAEKQARAARRMRWLTAGMTVMFLLALVTAAVAFKQKTDIASGLTREKAEKDKAVDAEMTAREAERKAREAEKRAGDEAKNAVKAVEERKEADIAKEAALAAQASAKKDAVRATEQERITAKNLQAIEEATKVASSVVRRAIPIVKQGDLLRRGTDAYRRQELNEALQFFYELRAQLETLRPGSTTQPTTPNLTIGELQEFAARIGELEQFSMQLGWTHSNIGATQLKRDEVSAAIESYEKALAIFKQLPESGNEPILLETYQGLAQAYRTVSSRDTGRDGSTQRESNSHEDQKRAEEYFKLAIAFQEKQVPQKPSELAKGCLNLARLYVDIGEFDEAEMNFKRAIELLRYGKNSSALDSNERLALAASLRELGEFYQGQQGQYDNAVKVFNEMITLQEDISLDGLALDGQAIANSYIDLGQIHASVGKSSKAEDAFRIARILQGTAILLRQKEKVQPGRPQERDVVNKLNAALDELGDAYVKLGKFSDAEAVYLTALSQRPADDSDLETSYDKLTTLYRKYKKDYPSAEKYSMLLLKFYEKKPQSAEYAYALVQLAALYAEDPNKPFEAAKNYNSALKIYRDQHDWWNENLILYRLTKLYEKQNLVTERKRALQDRVDTLATYFNRLATGIGPSPKDPVLLVSEYLQAVNNLAYFHFTNNAMTEAEAGYRLAFDARGYIAGNIYNEKILNFYMLVLKDYESLLKKLGNTELAAQVGTVIGSLREKRVQSDQIQKQQEQKLMLPSAAP